MKRRSFLKAIGVLCAGLAVAPSLTLKPLFRPSREELRRQKMLEHRVAMEEMLLGIEPRETPFLTMAKKYGVKVQTHKTLYGNLDVVNHPLIQEWGFR